MREGPEISIQKDQLLNQVSTVPETISTALQHQDTQTIFIPKGTPTIQTFTMTMFNTISTITLIMITTTMIVTSLSSHTTAMVTTTVTCPLIFCFLPEGLVPPYCG